MLKTDKYHVVGDGPFGVAMKNGVLEYDLIDARPEAEEICALLNRGIGPEWDEVESHMSYRVSSK